MKKAESMCLLDKVFWLEISVNKHISKNIVSWYVFGAIQHCLTSVPVPEQLGLQLGELQYGLHYLRKNHKMKEIRLTLVYLFLKIKELELMCIQELKV